MRGPERGTDRLVRRGTLKIASGGAGRGAANPFAASLKWCTWWAHEKRPDVYNVSVHQGAPRWGWDAHVWAERAKRYGRFPTGTKPMAGSLAVYSREYYGWPRNRGLGATYGHVAYVESVGAAGYTITEHSGDRRATPNRRQVPFGQPGVTFIYGGPAGNGPAAPKPAPAPPAPRPAPTPPAKPAPKPPTRRTIVVDNHVTNGVTAMREDPTPARLTTKPWTYCGSRGCNIAGTERRSGQRFDAAVCQTTGDRTTNGNDHDPVDDGNPGLFTSARYYGVRLANGTFGYVSEAWIRRPDRGGLGLPAC